MNWQSYSTVTYNALCANVDQWNVSRDEQRAITRIYYDLVFSSGMEYSGLISETARLLKSTEMTNDHFTIPQFVCRMIMSHPEKYLHDKDIFDMLFFLSRRVIKVTPAENNKLSKLTINTKDGFKLVVPTHLRYKHLGIKLFLREDMSRKSSWADSVECEDNALDIPQDMVQYERQFLLT